LKTSPFFFNVFFFFPYRGSGLGVVFFFLFLCCSLFDFGPSLSCFRTRFVPSHGFPPSDYSTLTIPSFLEGSLLAPHFVGASCYGRSCPSCDFPLAGSEPLPKSPPQSTAGKLLSPFPSPSTSPFLQFSTCHLLVGIRCVLGLISP